MSDSSIEVNGGRLQDFTIDQFAGATALILGSIGGLLMILWKSRCLCKCRIGCSDKCYLFDCERSPPRLEESDEEQQVIKPVIDPVGDQTDAPTDEDEPIVPPVPER